MRLPRSTHALDGYRKPCSTHDAAAHSPGGARGTRPLYSPRDSSTPLPEELTVLRTHQIVPPAKLSELPAWGVILAPSAGESSTRSKTNIFDESILIGRSALRWTSCCRAWPHSSKQRAMAAFLVPFTCTQLNASSSWPVQCYI